MLRRNIDIDLFRTFLAAIDLGGFNKAAAAMGRSQSAISMQLKRMEEGVGCTLFERHGRAMKLTASGEKLAGYARRLVALHDQTLDAMADTRVDGKVSLALMGDYATYVLPDVLAEFIALHPSIIVDVTTGFSADLLKQLGGKYDLVLSTHPLGEGQGERLRVEKTKWVFSSRHEMPAGDVIPLALLPPGNLFREWAIKALDEAGLRWRMAFTSTSIATVEAAAAAGIAVGVAKEGSAREGLRFLDRKHGFPHLPETEIVLNRSSGRYPTATQILGDFLAFKLGAPA
jgi:DNA-binding transcriptional LysR family regulator